MTLIILMYALFSTSFTVGKVLLTYATPLFLTGIRMSIAGIILLAYQYFWAHEQFRFKRKHTWYYAQMIVFGILITYTLRFWGLRDMPSSKTCFLYNLSPFMASLYSYFFFKEKITKIQWLGLIIGFLGLVPILITSSGPEAARGEVFWISWQELAIICSVATHSYSWVIMRKLVRDKNYSPMMVNGITMAVGGLIALIASLVFEGMAPIPADDILTFSGWLTFVIVVSNIICYNMYGYLLKVYTATFISFAGFLGPLFAALYGWAFLKETITWHFYLSAIIVFFGLYLFYKDELQANVQQL